MQRLAGLLVRGHRLRDHAVTALSLLGVVLLFGNVAGALVAPRAGRRSVVHSIFALALGLGAVVAPALWPSRAWPGLRTVLAFGTSAAFFRLVEILRHPEAPTAARVASTLYPVVSPQRLARIPSALHADRVLVGALFCGFAVGLYVMAWSFSPAAPYSGVDSAMRALVGGAAVYFVVDGGMRLTGGLAALAGYELGPLHDAPILSRSLAEFWGRRWNRAVHGWLDENAFRPAMRLVTRRAGDARARRRAMAAGVVAAFVASALLHLVPTWVALDARAAGSMGAFFVLQGALVVVEARTGVRRWPAPAGHAWTIVLLYATAPLFVEPLLRSMGH